MEIKVTTENGRVPVTVLHVDGSIDSATYEAFQAKAQELIKGGARHMLIDLPRAPYISNAGLRGLNNIFIRLRALSPEVPDEEMRKGINAGTHKSPHLKVLNHSKVSIMALNNSGFSMFIENFSDLKTVLASF